MYDPCISSCKFTCNHMCAKKKKYLDDLENHDDLILTSRKVRTSKQKNYSRIIDTNKHGIRRVTTF